MKALAVILCAAGCLAMIAFPKVSLEAARRGLGLWALTVVPALLPFFIGAGLMMRLGLAQRMAPYFEKPIRTFFRVPGCAAFAFIMSIVSGYPMGARIIADFREQRQVSKREAERMLSFCSTSGPLFMLGAVGAGMLGSVAGGWIIAVSHYLAAIVNGLIFRRHGKPDSGRLVPVQINVRNRAKSREGSIAVKLTESIFSAFRTLVLIGGYIVSFTLLTAFLDEIAFFSLPQNAVLAGLVKGAFEFTVGCHAISDSGLALLAKCTACSAIISWGGLSTHFQVASLLGKTDISMGFYVRAKLSHAVLAAVISMGLGGVLLQWGGAPSRAGTAGVFDNGPAGGEAASPGGIADLAMLVFDAASVKIAQVTTGSGLLAPSRMSVNSFEATQMFINKLLFSAQMIIMIMVIFALVSILGRMSCKFTAWVKKNLLRRKHAREEARAARAEAV